jgi:soluble lytic murein transglycosylase
MNKKFYWQKITINWAKFLPAVAGAIAIGSGIVWYSNQLNQEEDHSADPTLALVNVREKEQINSLVEIVRQQGQSKAGARARYLLATKEIERGQGDRAIQYLQGLEKSYPVLAAHILWQRALAYQLLNRSANFQATLQQLTQQYADSSIAVEALYILGKEDDRYWDTAIKKFPSHPRTADIIKQKLSQTPNRPDLLLILLKYLEPSSPERIKIADRLVTQYYPDLKPEQWDAIGELYWQNRIYNKAIAPLQKGTKTIENIYRTARSHFYSKQTKEAEDIYQEIIFKYPDSEEACKSLMALADLAQTTTETINYLDRAAALAAKQTKSKSPNSTNSLAAIALAKKAKILEKNNDKTAAELVRSEIVKKYPQSETAAAYRWQLARTAAAEDKLDRAWEFSRQIVADNPDSLYAPRASFWIGKWAQKLGKTADAKQAFEYTISKYSYSYYSWRSARYLGLDVGDFSTIRPLTPDVNVPRTRFSLPTGSEQLKELYLIGRDREAKDVWLTEFTNRQKPTVTETFTDGILANSEGKYIQGIAKLYSLEDREHPESKAEFEAISQQKKYWYNLYPLAFFETIKEMGSKHQINPLLAIGVIRQESRFMPKVKSPAGAVGLMQIIPDTAKFAAAKLGVKDYDMGKPEDNINFGTWYLNFTHQQVKDNSLLAIAGYNAGPGNVSNWVSQFGIADLDEFVERIPFPETENYVKNVLGNYWNYLRLYNPAIGQQVDRFLADKK